MPKTKLKKSRRKQTSLELSAPARCALRRIKANHGIFFTAAIERGVVALENGLNGKHTTP
ncbi:MAG: hypothetical protein PHY43_03985 [Verrucomicrobiales bacterium]|nr:hypothetical protein [Verrucomicrobiales bacterium]